MKSRRGSRVLVHRPGDQLVIEFSRGTNRATPAEGLRQNAESESGHNVSVRMQIQSFEVGGLVSGCVSAGCDGASRVQPIPGLRPKPRYQRAFQETLFLDPSRKDVRQCSSRTHFRQRKKEKNERSTEHSGQCYVQRTGSQAVASIHIRPRTTKASPARGLEEQNCATVY